MKGQEQVTTLNDLGLEEASSGLFEMLSRDRKWPKPEDWVAGALGRGARPDSSWSGKEPALHGLGLGLGRRERVCPQTWGSSLQQDQREVGQGWQRNSQGPVQNENPAFCSKTIKNFKRVTAEP